MSDQNKKLVDERFTLWQRNVRDQYKGFTTEDIKANLQASALPYAVLMSQIEGDFNIGTVIRSANFFGASKVFYYGKKKFDRRSTVGTHHYTDVMFLSSYDDIYKLKQQYIFVGLENNVPNTVPLNNFNWKQNTLLIIGEENKGISDEILALCDSTVEILNKGSVRSLNAGSAASIAMYALSTTLASV